MPLKIDIPDEDILYLNEPAKKELHVSTKRYVIEILEEADRLEAAHNDAGGNPEITSTMIRDAIIVLRRGYKKPRPSPKLIFLKISALISSLLVGIMFDYEELKNPILLILFIVVLAIAVALSVLLIVKE